MYKNSRQAQLVYNHFHYEFLRERRRRAYITCFDVLEVGTGKWERSHFQSWILNLWADRSQRATCGSSTGMRLLGS
jgi:hypothetical protein